MDYSTELAEMRARHKQELEELEKRRRVEGVIVTIQSNYFVTDDLNEEYRLEITFPAGLDFHTTSKIANAFDMILKNMIESFGFKDVKWLPPKRDMLEEQVEEENAKRKELAKKVVNELLDNGLGQSTWRDNNIHAYYELLKYRDDIELSVEKVLKEEKK